MNNDLQPTRDISNCDNPCAFMKMPRCMRQDASKRLDLDICQACIAGRIEGHIFALRENLIQKDPARRGNQQ